MTEQQQHADLIQAQQIILRLKRERHATAEQLRTLLARVDTLIAMLDEN